MADTVQFELVSPERQLASFEVNEVEIPGAEGDLVAMANHSPLITTLRPGVVKVSGPKGNAEYVVTGGFAEINAQGVSVLAERAIPREDVTRDHFQEMMDTANKNLARAQETFVNEPGPVDDAAKLLSDMVALGDRIGLTGN